MVNDAFHPAFEGAFLTVAFQVFEYLHESDIEHFEGIIAVTQVAHADGHHGAIVLLVKGGLGQRLII